MEMYKITKVDHSSNNLSWDIVLTVWVFKKKRHKKSKKKICMQI